MRKLLAVLFAVGVIGGVAGCSALEDETGRTKAKEHTVITSEGREVQCITIPDKYGFDCDWENARPNE